MKTLLKLQDRKMQIALFCVAMVVGLGVMIYLNATGVITLKIK
jgi:hypothetical protein